MASAFIGYSILVTLSGTPPRQLEGVVADVVDQTLVLKNGEIKLHITLAMDLTDKSSETSMESIPSS